MTASVRPRRRRATAWAVVGITLGVLLIGLEVHQGAPLNRAVEGVVILVAVIGAIWILQTRSETASTLAGKPVDERWQLINQQAMAVATSAGLIAAVAGFAVLEAQGRDNWQFAAMAMVLSASYLMGIAWYRWRA